MATLDTSIRPEVKGVLSSLKSRIRWYVIGHGVLLVLFLAALLFLFSVLIDLAWFAVTRFELAVWFRLSYLSGAAILLLCGLLYWIGLRLFRSIGTKPLALVLERRFPNLNDRLVTSVEAQQSITGRETELTQSMLQRTIDSASADARRLRVSDVFNTKPLIFAGVAAFLGVASVTAILASDYGRRWLDAYPYLQEVYVDRETELTVKILIDDSSVQGGGLVGSQIRCFDENQVYRHPRGAPLTLLINVPEKNESGKKLVVPKKVYVEYRYDKGETKTADCTQDKQRKRSFICTFANLDDSMEFHVVGNDYKNRKPYRIELVDPPVILKTNLVAHYPAYTGKNVDHPNGERIEVKGTETTLDAETRFVLDVVTNKPLRYARLEYGPKDARHVLEFGLQGNAGTSGACEGDATPSHFVGRVAWSGMLETQQARLHGALGSAASPLVKKAGSGPQGQPNKMFRRFERTIPEAVARKFFRNEEGNSGFRVPFILSKLQTGKARERVVEPFAEFEKEFPGLGGPLLMPAEGKIEIVLEDVNGIRSSESGSLTINVKDDEAPLIKANYRDIGKLVTASATIPLDVTVTDDHGVSLVRVEYFVAAPPKTSSQRARWRSREQDTYRPPRDQNNIAPRSYRFTTDIDVQNDDGELVKKTFNFRYFDMDELKVFDPPEHGPLADGPLWTSWYYELSKRKLKPGDRLWLRIHATDSDDINGPHEATSVQEFEFQVVSEEELIVHLHDRERRLRVDFEEIMRQIQRRKNVLELRLADVSRWRTLDETKPKAGQEEQHAAEKKDAEGKIRDTAGTLRADFGVSHNETREIESGFRLITSEYINNHIKTAELKDQANVSALEKFVIGKLNQANRKGGDYDQLDTAMRNYGSIVRDKEVKLNPEQVDESVRKCVREVDELLVTLNAALDQMKQLVAFREAVKQLQTIIMDESELSKIIQDLRRKTFGD